MDPAIVSICVQHTSTTWPRLADVGTLGVSVLSSTQEAMCRQIAAKSADRFAGVSWFTRGSGPVFLANSTAWLDCTISTTIPAGDHDVVLLEVNHAAIDDSAQPLIFHASTFRTLAIVDDPR